MGDHYVAVRPGALDISYNSSDSKWHAKMNATADQLKGAPEYKYPIRASTERHGRGVSVTALQLSLLDRISPGSLRAFSRALLSRTVYAKKIVGSVDQCEMR